MAISDLVITKTVMIYFVIGFLILILTIVNLWFMKRSKMFKKSKKPFILPSFSFKKEIKVQAEKKIKVKVKSKKGVDDTEIQSYSPIKSKSKWSFAYWKEKYMDKYNVGNVILINMELLNGFHRLFLVTAKDEGFVFKKKKYLFDDESKYYNLDAKYYTFDFHEGLVLPIKRKIPVTDIRKTIESANLDIEYAINPSTLQRFMTAKIAEGVMKGTQLDEFMKKLNMFIIVIMVAVLVHLALFIYASGILKNIQLPF